MAPKQNAISAWFAGWPGLAALMLFAAHSSAAVRPAATETGPTTQQRIAQNYGQLPLAFEANLGQTDSHAQFLSRGIGHTLLLGSDGAELSIRAQHEQRTLRMTLVNANRTAQAAGLEPLPGKVNYYIGKDPKQWRTNVPTYAKVSFRGVYHGVDLVYYGRQHDLEYDFVVAPGADPNQIKVRLEGAQISVDSRGAIVASIAGSVLRLEKPVIYQEVGGRRRQIAGGYALRGANDLVFDVGGYDHNKALVIDPAVVLYSASLGGTDTVSGDFGSSIAVDSAGNAYITGGATSTDFPVTPGAAQASFAGVLDAFITKINATGTAVLYSTYLGGTGVEEGRAIAIDGTGSAYVTGETTSFDFPIRNALQSSHGGGANRFDAFVAKVNPFGALTYSTYLGGPGDDRGFGIAVDAAENAYVTGLSSGNCNANVTCTFPTTANALKTAFAPSPPGESAGQVFVSKLNHNGNGFVYSTLLGGDAGITGQFPEGITVDPAGSAYVIGSTYSPDFPVVNAFQSSLKGSVDAFVSKLSPAGNALLYSTFLGGGGFEEGVGIAVDALGKVYVTGNTDSADFPALGPAQAAYGGNTDIFLTKIDPALAGAASLVYSTYFGGSDYEQPTGIGVDASGNVYVSGNSNSSNFPLLNPIPGSHIRAILAKFNPAGSALVYSTFIPDTIAYQATGSSALAVDGAGNAYFLGRSPSLHVGIAKIADLPVADLTITKVATSSPAVLGSNLAYLVTVTNNGPSAATSVTVTDTLPGSVVLVSATASQGSCTGASTIVCTLGALTNAASATVTIVARPSVIGPLSNTAIVAGAELDSDTNNNSSTATVTVAPSADLAMVKSAAPDPVTAGNNLNYSLTITNAGPSPATGITVNDVLPAGVALVSATATQGTCSGGGSITCSVGTLPNGGAATVSIVVKTTSAGIITNTAGVVAIESDPNPGDNSASVSTTVNPGADLSISMASSPNPAFSGTNLTYTINATNGGPSAATGVTIVDSVPAGVTFVSASASQGTCSGSGLVTCALGNLSNGGTATATIVVKPTSTATITNAASVMASETDAILANNTASVTTTVNPPSPSQQISDLIAVLDSFHLGPPVQSLLQKLQGIQDKIAKGQQSAACNDLNAFNSEVTAQTGKLLTSAQASLLVGGANQLRTTLGC